MTYEQEQLFEAAKKLQKVCDLFLCEECPMYTEMRCRQKNRETNKREKEVEEEKKRDKKKKKKNKKKTKKKNNKNIFFTFFFDDVITKRTDF